MVSFEDDENEQANDRALAFSARHLLEKGVEDPDSEFPSRLRPVVLQALESYKSRLVQANEILLAEQIIKTAKRYQSDMIPLQTPDQ